MLRTRPNAAVAASNNNARRSSLEVGSGAETNNDKTTSTSTGKKEFRFPRQQRRRKRTSKRLMSSLQRGLHRRLRHYLNKHPQKALPFAIVCTGVAILVLFALFELFQVVGMTKPSSKSTILRPTISNDFEIVFPKQQPEQHHWRMHKNGIQMPIPWRDEDYFENDKEDNPYIDYGGLEMDFFAEDSARRNIWYDFQLEDGFQYFSPLKQNDEDQDEEMEDLAYFAFDDDFKRDEYGKDTEYDYQCRRTHQHRLNFPTCNVYHEIDFIQSQGTYLNAGAYRQVMVGKHDNVDKQERIIFKDIHFDFEATEENYEFVRMDAIVAERLTASPRIYDIYGFCGLGILSEFFPHGDLEAEIVPNEDASVDEGYDPQNVLSPLEKLLMAKQMADAVADLHGHAGGIIVHQDIQLSQFLWNADKTMVKLNDFNRAEFVLFDDHKNKYCGYWEGVGSGSWRAAEEYADRALTEKVDVFSLGNNFFSILTGVDPFNEKETPEIQKLVQKGVKAPLSEAFRTHSFAEKRLAHLIDHCHEHKPADRPTIFEIVEYLEASIRDAMSKGET
ncbi:unnamed protein product [Cylindrotheca closterium]|uniref:Protein kinase domain-containing protein n=1 Tax=Cylindrotheca closterium TaxID=2856 RepID=A0AAD2JPE1_9STRA|nr:unnamed protein product [Cylindrotheca closterium]